MTKGSHKSVKNFMGKVFKQFPDTKWIQVMNHAGLLIGEQDKIYVDENNIQDLGANSPISIGSLSLAERIAERNHMDKFQFSIISGTTSTIFVIPIGSGNEYVLTMCIEGQPSLDEVMKYFADHDYFSEEEIWN